MADKKDNIFKRIGKKFTDIIAELKRVTWPPKDKLAKTSAVVLLVILFFAVYLTLIGTGGRWVLDQIGFYDVVETEATIPTTSEMVVELPASEAETEPEASSEG
ncbi:MAG: preprotein translocase subunit SecE [Clostridiales bacterium]|nr:preprotein translocase subunit SecE [Clostridiales bacterium]